MSMELDAVIESCVRTIQGDPQRTREEVAQLLNRWEDVGLISRQMRAVIVKRLRNSQPTGQADKSKLSE
ncbi:MAG TPA: hypothetical protein VF844_02970 [Ktedonobacteraceae bacterium]